MSQYGVPGLALARSARHRVLRCGYHIESLGDAVLDSRIPEGLRASVLVVAAHAALPVPERVLRVCELVAYAFFRAVFAQYERAELQNHFRGEEKNGG